MPLPATEGAQSSAHVLDEGPQCSGKPQSNRAPLSSLHCLRGRRAQEIDTSCHCREGHEWRHLADTVANLEVILETGRVLAILRGLSLTTGGGASSEAACSNVLCCRTTTVDPLRAFATGAQIGPPSCLSSYEQLASVWLVTSNTPYNTAYVRSTILPTISLQLRIESKPHRQCAVPRPQQTAAVETCRTQRASNLKEPR